MAAQPGATGPNRAQATQAQTTRMRATAGRSAGRRRRGAAPGPDGSRPARGRRNAPWSRLGTWQGGLGVCVIVASAAIGAIGTMLSRSEPGFLLQLFVVAGTVSAALAIRPRAGRMIIPVPALSYVVAALLSGIVFDRSASSRTVLAVDAAQWIANGFFAMALATVLAAGIAASRWYLGHRRRPDPRDQDWRPPMPPGAPARADRRPTEAWSDPGPRGTGPRPGSPPRPGSASRPGSAPQKPQVPPTPAGPQARRTQGPPRRTGSEPYNFSSGA